MPHLCRVVLLLLFLPGGARRSIRVGESHHAAQQQSNTVVDELVVSGESQEALIPGGLETGVLRRGAARAAAALHGGSTTNGQRRGNLDARLPTLRRGHLDARLPTHAIFQDYGVFDSPLAKVGIAAIDLNNCRNRGGGVSMMAEKDEVVPTVEDKKREKLLRALDGVDANTRDKLVKVMEQVDESIVAGITPPLGFFDPVGFAADATPGKLLFYREVELKHGRVAMLASLGLLVGEQFHPLFGGDIDVPSYIAFQQTPLQSFWRAVVAAIAIPEIFSVFTFQNPAGSQPWTIRADQKPGDLGFDPLGLKPTDPEEFTVMQTKELNNGRLAMIATAGMIAQELASGEKLF